MTTRTERYDRLAELFAYPDDGYVAKLAGCAGALAEGYPAASAALAPLIEHVREMTDEEIQEFYTRTFDINPVCTLEIGWHIYGEDYARGELLVMMRQKLREANLPESAELPDHLTHVLPLLARLSGEEADELVARYLLPGLQVMLDGMSDGEHPYRALLEVVGDVAGADHDVVPAPPRQRRSDPPDWNNRLPVFGQQAQQGSCGPCSGPSDGGRKP